MADRALIVEDDDETRALLAVLLKSDAWEVETAENGLAAMEKFWGAARSHRPFRLIVMDMAMPEMDGFTAAEKIRRAERENGLPRSYMLGFTGYPQFVMSEEALRRADLDDLKTKPAAPGELRAVFAEARANGRGSQAAD